MTHRPKIESMEKMHAQGNGAQHPGMGTARSSNSHRDWDMSEMIDEDEENTMGNGKEDSQEVKGGVIGDVDEVPVFNSVNGNSNVEVRVRVGV